MERNATIRIKESKHGDPILFSAGTIVKLGNSWNVSYVQNGANYTIGISDGLVSISREGEEDYAILLREGKEHDFKIATPYGHIPMKVVAENIFYKETEDGLVIDLIYYLVGGNGEKQKFSLFLDCIYEQ